MTKGPLNHTPGNISLTIENHLEYDEINEEPLNEPCITCITNHCANSLRKCVLL